MPAKNNNLRNYYIIVTLILVLFFLYDKYADTPDIEEIQRQVFEDRKPQPAPPQQVVAPRQEHPVSPPPASLNQHSQTTVPEPSFGNRIDLNQGNPFGPVPESTDIEVQQLFREHYAGKLANPDYIARKNRKGIPGDYQNFPEERLIKQDRARISAGVKVPNGVTPLSIPFTTGKPPHIDGYVKPQEWNDAIAIPIGEEGVHTRIYMISDGKRLYLACTVPDDSTREGFDQFRFYYHLNTILELVNERIHVDGSGTATPLRATNILWTGSPPENDDERWKKYPISDWVIYKLHDGASTLHPYRQYELSLDLEEAGLHVGIPFPARFEVETDPTRTPEGKFKHRNYLGKLGTDINPVWFEITYPATSSGSG